MRQNALQATSTGELERLAGHYQMAGLSPHLNDFERSAVLSAIYGELVERDAIHKGGFRFPSEKEHLAAVICYVAERASHFEAEANALDALLEVSTNGDSTGESEGKE